MLCSEARNELILDHHLPADGEGLSASAGKPVLVGKTADVPRLRKDNKKAKVEAETISLVWESVESVQGGFGFVVEDAGFGGLFAEAVDDVGGGFCHEGFVA